MSRDTRSARQWVGVALLLGTLCCVSAAVAQASRLTVAWQDGRLSVHAEQVPLARILQEIARHSGIEVRGFAGLQELIAVHFVSLPLAEGLQRLPVNSAIIWQTVPHQDRQPVLVVVFRQEPSAPPGPVAVQQEHEAEQVALAPVDQAESLTMPDILARQGNEALRQAIADTDQTVQATAFEVLAERDQQQAVAALVDATQSEHTEIRGQALELLHQTDQAEESTVLAALGAAAMDEDDHVKEYAIQALADRGTGPDVLGYLRQAFHDPNPEVRKLVIEHVVPQDQGLQLLREALRDADETVRAVARMRLLQSGSTERRRSR